MKTWKVWVIFIAVSILTFGTMMAGAFLGEKTGKVWVAFVPTSCLLVVGKVATDIGERKRREKKMIETIQQLRIEIDEKNKEIDRLKAKIEKVKMKDETRCLIEKEGEIMWLPESALENYDIRKPMGKDRTEKIRKLVMEKIHGKGTE